MTEAQFRVTVAADGTTPEVAACGDIDLANVSDFQDTMTSAASASAILTVDLTKVNYCDSAAVRALFSVAATTELIMIVSASGPLTNLFGISGLDRVATVVTKE